MITIEQLKNVAILLGVLGVPSIFTMTVSCIKKCNNYTKQLVVLLKAQQAQMRSQLLDQYHFYIDQGYISDEDLEDWENQYQSYHSLGSNGILDRKRDELLNMPNKPKGE